MSTITYSVKGMTCSHCVGSVTKEVEKVAGIDQIEVDVANGRLTVTSSAAVDDEAVVEAVEEAGYEAARV